MSTNGPIKAILADGDGCLYQTKEHITQATLLTAQSFNIPTDAERIRFAFSQGLSAHEMFKLVAPEIEAEEFTGRFYEFGEQIGFESIVLYPGANFALEAMKRASRKLALITNRARASTQAIINQVGIAHFLDDVVTADDGIVPKPDPDGALRSLRDLGVSAAASVVIGDAAGDIQMGTNANVRATIGFTEGFSTIEQLEAANPTLLMDSWYKLPRLIAALD